MRKAKWSLVSFAEISLNLHADSVLLPRPGTAGASSMPSWAAQSRCWLRFLLPSERQCGWWDGDDTSVGALLPPAQHAGACRRHASRTRCCFQEGGETVWSLLRCMQKILYVFNEWRQVLHCIQPVVSRRDGYEMFCGKIAKAILMSGKILNTIHELCEWLKT